MENKKLDFRVLGPEDVNIRIGGFQEYGVEFLVFKKSYVDRDILDEIVGPMNWKCTFEDDLKVCCISIYDAEKKEWIGKSDSGDASRNAAYPNKQQATDAFKRAGCKWGIGNELKSLPRILVTCKTKLTSRGYEPVNWHDKVLYMPHVKEMEFTKKRKCKRLVIENGDGEILFEYSQKKGIETPMPKAKPDEPAPEPDLLTVPSIDFEDPEENVYSLAYEVPEMPEIPEIPTQQEPNDNTPDPVKDLRAYVEAKGQGKA